MEYKQNPFSIYDFLGYLIPGSTTLYLALLIYGHLEALPPLDAIKTYLNFQSPEIYIPFIMFSYTIGHLVSYLSSITVEKYSIWQYSYPSKYLLGVAYNGYFGERPWRFRRLGLRGFVWLLLFPITFIDFLFGKIIGFKMVYTKSLDQLLINILRNKSYDIITTEAGITINPSHHGTAENNDFFRYIYHYAVDNSPHHLAKMQNYVALYGFLRTITLIFTSLFWAALWHVIHSDLTLAPSLFILVSISLISYCFFMSFTKFYRRFTLEALMAAAVSYKK